VTRARAIEEAARRLRRRMEAYPAFPPSVERYGKELDAALSLPADAPTDEYRRGVEDEIDFLDRWTEETMAYLRDNGHTMTDEDDHALLFNQGSALLAKWQRRPRAPRPVERSHEGGGMSTIDDMFTKASLALNVRDDEIARLKVRCAELLDACNQKQALLDNAAEDQRGMMALVEEARRERDAARVGAAKLADSWREMEFEAGEAKRRLAELETALREIADYRDTNLAIGFVAVRDYARAALAPSSAVTVESLYASYKGESAAPSTTVEPTAHAGERCANCGHGKDEHDGGSPEDPDPSMPCQNMKCKCDAWEPTAHASEDGKGCEAGCRSRVVCGPTMVWNGYGYVVCPSCAGTGRAR
jgi:hypothetical protein